MTRRQLLYTMKYVGSFYMCIEFQLEVLTQFKDTLVLTNSQLFLTDPRSYICRILL